MGLMDWNLDFLRGAIMVGLIIAFLGMWAWAWSSKRKDTFHSASMMPLEEDDGHIPQDTDETQTDQPARTRHLGIEE